MYTEIDALIFDMDGVITDSEPLQIEAEKWVCDAFNISVPNSEWVNFKGKTNRDIFSYICEKYTNGRAMDIDELIYAKRKRYLEIAESKMELVPMAMEFLKHVRPKFHKIGLTTSSSRKVQAFVFNRYKLHAFFDVTTTGDEVSKGKPDPEPYTLTLTKLESEASRTLVIEDSDNGVRSAKNAGCYVAAITTSFPADYLKECGADAVVNNFNELRGLIS